jgi:glycosyltransferase involved in cell wall biosynthesis
MRILQVSSPVQHGGGETHVLELTEGLRRLGHEVLVAGRRGGAVKPDIKFPFLNAMDLVTVFGLRRLLKREKFDIIHAHVARDYPLVAVAAGGAPGKLVYTRHLLYPVKAAFLYDRVDGWIAPTRQIMETLAPMKPRVSAVIPNWVDLDKFRFNPHPPHTPLVLGVLGQVSPHKGHDDAIEALRILGPGFRLIIGGKGDPKYLLSLKQKAAGLPVYFPGFVSLPDFFQMVDVLLVPSWEEPFGIVLLEAMASGIPVVASSTGGPLEIIRPGEGILVPPRDPKSLANGIRSLMPLRERIVGAARRRVEQAFDIRSTIPKIDAFYRTL